jgi:hypothetical protein
MRSRSVCRCLDRRSRRRDSGPRGAPASRWRVRAQVVRIVGSGEEVTSGQIPFTPRAKKVLEREGRVETIRARRSR